MILHDHSLIFRAEGVGDVLAFLVAKDYSPIIRIYGQVVVEQTCVLLHNIDWLAERGPGPSVQTMTMSGGYSIGSSLMERMMNHVACLIDWQLCAVLCDIAIGTDQH